MYGNKFGRRALLERSLVAGASAAALVKAPWAMTRAYGLLPGVDALFRQFARDPLAQSINGFDYLADAMAGGLSLLRFCDQAYAAGAVADTYFININVTCGISPKFFTVFQTPDGNGTLPKGLVASGKLTDSKNYLVANGLERVTTLGEGGAWGSQLRMTEWFGNILMNGSDDGKSRAAANVPASIKKYVADFPAADVKIQMAHQLTGGTSHLFKSLLLDTNSYGDINYELQKGGLLSPLQILAFGVGAVDVNSGDNRVSGPGNSTELSGKTTANFLQTVKQLVADSYISTSKCAENNVICQFDKLAKSQDAVSLRETMLGKIADIRGTIAAMSTNVQAVTADVHRFDLSMGMQAPVKNTDDAVMVGPNLNFLSQVATTCELVKNLDAYRNFSLYLNLVDLDTDVFDTLKNNEALTGVGQNYVNGHRQIAMAMNMLAKLMKDTGKKIIVHICADTGRSSITAGDAVGSTAILMAPKSTKLTDYLYFDDTMLTDSSNIAAQDPSQNPVPWNKNLKKADGTPDNLNATAYKNWAAGVYKFVLGSRFFQEPYVEIEKSA